MTDQNKPEDTVPEKEPAVQPDEAPTGTPPSEGPEELPYIDDPVSKWWIGIIIAVFAVIFAWAIFFGSGGLFGDVLHSDDATPSPEPTLAASPSPAVTEAPSPEPTLAASPSPAASDEPSPEPTGSPESSPTG